MTFQQHFICILFLITATKENLLMLHQKVGCVCVYSVVVFIFSPLHFWRSGSVRRGGGGAGYPSIYLVEDFYIYILFSFIFFDRVEKKRNVCLFHVILPPDPPPHTQRKGKDFSSFFIISSACQEREREIV